MPSKRDRVVRSSHLIGLGNSGFVMSISRAWPLVVARFLSPSAPSDDHGYMVAALRFSNVRDGETQVALCSRPSFPFGRLPFVDFGSESSSHCPASACGDFSAAARTPPAARRRFIWIVFQ